MEEFVCCLRNGQTNSALLPEKLNCILKALCQLLDYLGQIEHILFHYTSNEREDGLGFVHFVLTHKAILRNTHGHVMLKKSAEYLEWTHAVADYIPEQFYYRRVESRTQFRRLLIGIDNQLDFFICVTPTPHFHHFCHLWQNHRCPSQVMHLHWIGFSI